MTVRPHTAPLATRTIATTVASRTTAGKRRHRPLARNPREDRALRITIAISCIAAGIAWLVVFG